MQPLYCQTVLLQQKTQGLKGITKCMIDQWREKKRLKGEGHRKITASFYNGYKSREGDLGEKKEKKGWPCLYMFICSQSLAQTPQPACAYNCPGVRAEWKIAVPVLCLLQSKSRGIAFCESFYRAVFWLSCLLTESMV